MRLNHAYSYYFFIIIWFSIYMNLYIFLQYLHYTPFVSIGYFGFLPLNLKTKKPLKTKKTNFKFKKKRFKNIVFPPLEIISTQIVTSTSLTWWYRLVRAYTSKENALPIHVQSHNHIGLMDGADLLGMNESEMWYTQRPI